jgi:hypothetical protein
MLGLRVESSPHVLGATVALRSGSVARGETMPDIRRVVGLLAVVGLAVARLAVAPRAGAE